MPFEPILVYKIEFEKGTLVPISTETSQNVFNLHVNGGIFEEILPKRYMIIINYGQG